MTSRVLATKSPKPKFILLAVMLGVSFFALVFAGSVRAEPKAVSFAPTANKYLDYNNTPVEVVIQFSEKLKADGSTFTVTKEDGVDKGVAVTPVLNATDPTKLQATLPKASDLGANKYTVTYTVTGADSNQVGAGSYSFYVIPPSKSFWELGYIFSAPNTAFTSDWKGYTYPPLATTYFFIALLGTIVGAFFYLYGRYRFFSNNRLIFTVVGRASRNLAIISGLGFLFFLCRIGNLQPLNARVLLYGVAVFAIVQLVRGLGYMLRTYPKARAEWQNLQDKSRSKREKGIAPVVPAPIKVSADAGDEGDEEKQEAVRAALDNSQRGLSKRGEKRRARKKN